MDTEQANTLLDTTLLMDYVTSLGKSVVEQMFNLYSQQSAIYLSDIEKAQLSDSLALWQEHCHKMKGAAGSVGLKETHKKLILLEKTTATKDEKAKMLEELKKLNENALLAFNNWLVTVTP